MFDFRFWFSLFSAALHGERLEIYLPVRFSLFAPVFRLPSRRIEVMFRGEIGFRVQKFDYRKQIIYLGFAVIMVTRFMFMTFTILLKPKYRSHLGFTVIMVTRFMFMSFTILLRLDQSLSVNGQTDLRTNDRPHRQTLPIKNRVFI